MNLVAQAVVLLLSSTVISTAASAETRTLQVGDTVSVTQAKYVGDNSSVDTILTFTRCLDNANTFSVIADRMPSSKTISFAQGEILLVRRRDTFYRMTVSIKDCMVELKFEELAPRTE